MTEKQGLHVSAAGNLFMALLGGTFAVLASSDAILFDAFFSFVQLVMVGVNLWIASLLARGPTPSFQFGYFAFEPLVITIRGLMIMAGAAYASWMAVVAILTGGRELALGMAVAYAAIAAAGCFLLSRFQGRSARSSSSPMLQVDAEAWKMDGLLSVGVALAFLVGFLLRGTSLDGLLVYLDPALVLILVAVLIGIPFRTIRDGLAGLLGAAPGPGQLSAIEDRSREALARFGLEPGKLRIGRVGRVVYVMQHVLVPEDFGDPGVEGLDRIRDEVEEAVSTVAPRVEIDTVFTGDPRWLED